MATRWWLLVLMPLGACQGNGDVVAGQTPAVRAIGPSSAELDITECSSPHDDQKLQHVLTILETNGLLVAGRDGGSAKLVINLCGGTP